MKQGIHPQWFAEAKVVCACGNTFITGSTVSEIRVEICSNCHPLYTGQMKLVDTLGQVDRYNRKIESSKVKQAQRAQVMEARKSKVAEQKKDKPTLKDLLMQARKQAAS